MDNIKVSISMITYNHSKYIEKAIRSVMMQQTNFNIELIVADDASKDNTQEIIKKLCAEFPDKIKPVLRQKNIGSHRNSFDSISRCRGEYIAILEGDDFWTDPEKLQKQVDFLDSHKDYCACYHKNIKVDDDSNVLEENDARFDIVGDYTVEDVCKFLLPGQLGTVMVRQEVMKSLDSKLLAKFYLKLKNIPGDRIIPIYMLSKGKIYCMQDVMSAYRWVLKKGGENWSSKNSQNDERSHWLLIKTRQDMELLGDFLNLPINFEKEEYDAFIDALWKYKFLDKKKYLFNIIYMYFFSNHKIYLRENAIPELKAEIAKREKVRYEYELDQKWQRSVRRKKAKEEKKRRFKEKWPKLTAFLKKVKKVLLKISFKK